MSTRPAVFLDRDGVINEHRAYIIKAGDIEFVDGIFDLCRYAKELGFLIFVVTNQAGIGRGYYTEEDFLELTEWMLSEFSSNGVLIDKVYFCPFHSEHGQGSYKKDSFHRKPNPGMILEATDEFDVDLTKSVLIGDQESDIQAGIAAGVGCNLLYYSSISEDSIETSATAVIHNLTQAKTLILEAIDK